MITAGCGEKEVDYSYSAYSVSGNWNRVKDFYQREDVTYRCDKLFEAEEGNPGTLDALGVTVDELLTMRDTFLVAEIWRQFATSGDSCDHRDVTSEVERIRHLEKQLKTEDFASLGLTEDMLVTCQLTGQIFPTRERLLVIQANAYDTDYSNDIAGIINLAERAPWGLNDVPITLDSLKVLEITCKLSSGRKAAKNARVYSNTGNLERLQDQLKSLGTYVDDITEKYAGSHPAWDDGIQELRIFLSDHSRTNLFERAHQFQAYKWARYMRRMTPSRNTNANPVYHFKNHQEQSGHTLGYYGVTQTELAMWTRKWS